MPELNGGPADAQIPDARAPDARTPEAWAAGGAWAAGVSSPGPAVDHGAQVIFIDSMYGYPPSKPLESAVRDAVARNVVIVAEDEDFGSGADGYDYPASMPG